MSKNYGSPDRRVQGIYARVVEEFSIATNDIGLLSSASDVPEGGAEPESNLDEQEALLSESGQALKAVHDLLSVNVNIVFEYQSFFREMFATCLVLMNQLDGFEEKRLVEKNSALLQELRTHVLNTILILFGRQAFTSRYDIN